MTVFLLSQLVLLVDETPEPEDVKAGWTAFAVFLLLIGAVAFLGFSLTKHLRRAQAAEEAGLYGSDDGAAGGETPGSETPAAETPAAETPGSEVSDADSEPHQAP
jgi:hypothetical protein